MLSVTITVNLAREEHDLEYNVNVVQEAIDQAAKQFPKWESMVVVFSNKRDKE